MNTDTHTSATCLFKAGDEIYDASRRLIARVTAVTDKGFEYTHDAIPFISREGSSFVGGTCYPTGYSMWRAVTANDRINLLVDRANLSLTLHCDHSGQPDGYTFYSQARGDVPVLDALASFDDAGEEAIYTQLVSWVQENGLG